MITKKVMKTLYTAGGGGFVLAAMLWQMQVSEEKISDKLNDISAQLQVLTERGKNSEKEREATKQVADNNRATIHAMDTRLSRVEVLVNGNKK